MIIGKVLIEKMKAAGIAEAEVVAKKVFVCAKETLAEVAIHPEADASEKIVCSVAAPVVAGLESAVDKAIDFNKDGKIG